MSPFMFLSVANLLLQGVLAGMELGLHYGLAAGFRALPAQLLIETRQALIRRLRVLIAVIAAPAAVSVFRLYVQSEDEVLLFRAGALVAMAVWVAARVFATVPINRATLGWNAASPPDNWRESISRADRFHMLGAWAAVLGFVFAAVAVALQSCTR
jgi:hypothetical protein